VWRGVGDNPSKERAKFPQNKQDFIFKRGKNIETYKQESCPEQGFLHREKKGALCMVKASARGNRRV
jgi:hypothetical protein